MFYLSANYLFIKRFVRVNTGTQTVLNLKVSDKEIFNVIPSSKRLSSHFKLVMAFLSPMVDGTIPSTQLAHSQNSSISLFQLLYVLSTLPPNYLLLFLLLVSILSFLLSKSLFQLPHGPMTGNYSLLALVPLYLKTPSLLSLTSVCKLLTILPMISFRTNCMKVDNVESSDELSILDLPHLALESILLPGSATWRVFPVH